MTTTASLSPSPASTLTSTRETPRDRLETRRAGGRTTRHEYRARCGVCPWVSSWSLNAGVAHGAVGRHHDEDCPGHP